RVVLLEDDTVLRADHIPQSIRQGTAAAKELSAVRRIEAALSRPFPDEGMAFEELMDGVERELIGKAMREAGGNQSRAARYLQLNRDKIRYRLKNLNMEQE
ncbi:MAG TPA: helix-turn-helix domain-containing protein, partial [Candidatus Krumholzibacteriaceae bacterium]